MSGLGEVALASARLRQVVQRSGKWFITDLGIARIDDRIVKELASRQCSKDLLTVGGNSTHVWRENDRAAAGAPCLVRWLAELHLVNIRLIILAEVSGWRRS